MIFLRGINNEYNTFYQEDSQRFIGNWDVLPPFFCLLLIEYVPSHNFQVRVMCGVCLLDVIWFDVIRVGCDDAIWRDTL